MFVSTSLGSFYSAVEDGTNFILTITFLYNNNYFFYKKKTTIVKKITIVFLPTKKKDNHVTFLKYSTTFWFYFLQMKTRGNYGMFQLLRNFYASHYLGITVVILNITNTTISF